MRKIRCLFCTASNLRKLFHRQKSVIHRSNLLINYYISSDIYENEEHAAH